jgi:hypothetical protein
MRDVTIASAALNTDGFGYKPPNGWKWRSGVHIAAKPCSSAYFRALYIETVRIAVAVRLIREVQQTKIDRLLPQSR